MGARDLARATELLCSRGIELRDEGLCLGAPRAGEIAVRCGRVVLVRRSAGVRGRHAAHAARGHAPGCAELGVPRETVERLLLSWDAAGARGLLLEAVDEAIDELRVAEAAGAAWNVDAAREAVAHAVRTRITPSAGDAPTGNDEAGPPLVEE